MKHADFEKNSTICPTERELRWFAQIARHGPQSSEFLFELTRDTHRCKDTALRRLQVLREARFLRLPPQQRHIAKADFNPFVYDLTKTAEIALKTYGLDRRDIRPTGHWWHGVHTSAITSAIDILATRAGHEFIPAERILGIRNASLAIPLSKGKVIPDQLFALKTAQGYRAFALEVDRGTEPVASTVARKSLTRSIDQYGEILERGVHLQHYGLKCNLLVLWVFSSTQRQARFLKRLEQEGGRAKATILTVTSRDGLPKWKDMVGLVGGRLLGVHGSVGGLW